MSIEPYAHAHFEEVDRLWTTVFPNDSERNRAVHAVPRKLATGDGLFWVALDEKDAVIGTIMAGWDGHRGWLYSVAVAPCSRNGKVGSALVETALEALSQRGCNKVNLQIRSGNKSVTKFYETLGFKVEPMVSMGRTL